MREKNKCYVDEYEFKFRLFVFIKILTNKIFFSACFNTIYHTKHGKGNSCNKLLYTIAKCQKPSTVQNGINLNK